MYRLISLLVILHIYAFCNGQNTKHVFQDYFNDIVYTQVFNKLVVDLNDAESEINPFDIPGRIFENEIINSLNCNFTSSAYEDSNFIVNAFIKKKQIIYIINSVNENTQQLSISSPNGETSKQADYKNDRLEKVVIKDKSEIDIIEYSYMEDSIILKKSFNTSKMKYDLFEERYKNELLQSEIFYKKSKSPEAKIVEKSVNYYYDQDERLIKEITVNHKGLSIDSTLYFYKNSLLTSVVKYVMDGQNSILYRYNSKALPEKKSVLTADMQIELNYVYDNSNRVESIEIKRLGSSYWMKCFFYFNQDSKLIAMKTYKINREDEQLYLRSQYLFNYKNDGMLQSLKAVNKKGNKAKEVKYEVEYISN